MQKDVEAANTANVCPKEAAKMEELKVTQVMAMIDTDQIRLTKPPSLSQEGGNLESELEKEENRLNSALISERNDLQQKVNKLQSNLYEEKRAYRHLRAIMAVLQEERDKMSLQVSNLKSVVRENRLWIDKQL